MTEHTHHWVHVATIVNGLPVIVCSCACGVRLTPRQVYLKRELASGARS